MKRQLDKQELEYTKKGIERLKRENKDLMEQVEFNRLTINFQKAQAEYQDATRPYLRKKKEKDDKKVMENLKEQVTRNEATIVNLQEQLENGVTIKNSEEVK